MSSSLRFSDLNVFRVTRIAVIVRRLVLVAAILNFKVHDMPFPISDWSWRSQSYLVATVLQQPSCDCVDDGSIIVSR